MINQMRSWFPSRRFRKHHGCAELQEQSIETEFIWSLLDIYCCLSQSLAVSLHSSHWHSCLIAAAWVILGAKMLHVNHIQMHVFGQRREHSRLLLLSGSSVLPPPDFSKSFAAAHSWADESRPWRIMFNRRSSRNKLFIIKFLIIGMLTWTHTNCCKDAKNKHIPASSSLISQPAPSTTPHAGNF